MSLMGLPRPATPVGALAGVLAVALAVSLLGAPACTVGDAICTDHTVEEDRDDSCPYGPPGGPQRTKAEGCEYQLDDANCTVTFRDDVYPILVAPSFGAESGGGCTQAACHGASGTGATALVVAEDATPDELYAAMAAVVGDNGAPYVEEGAEDAYFLCNLFGTLGGGSAMPPTAGLTDDPSTPDDDGHAAVIEEWVRCGMKLDGAGSGGGGMGAGGMGAGGMGVGGAGGA